MYHNIDRPAVVIAGIAVFVFIIFMAAKDQVRKFLDQWRLEKALDANVDNPANIEALARSIGVMRDTDKQN
jgi:hypothetical protein